MSSEKPNQTKHMARTLRKVQQQMLSQCSDDSVVVNYLSSLKLPIPNKLMAGTTDPPLYSLSKYITLGQLQ